VNIRVFTIFPEMFEGPFTSSLLHKAREKGILNIEIINFREYSQDKHKTVDDYPYGGGVGMVLKPEPIINALEDKIDLSNNDQEVILLTPQGKVFNQQEAINLSTKKSLAFICGHYEGFDERIRKFVTKEYSLGDYVLTGGELPAMVIIDAVARLIPGVIKEKASFQEDSFYTGLLEYPQYTRPRIFRELEVPDVLLSGNHERIRLWRKKEALRRTLFRRPDLLAKYQLTKEEEKLLKEIKEEDLKNG
jgi:tRNA (guanine37-N1)-methyltransferase